MAEVILDLAVAPLDRAVAPLDLAVARFVSPGQDESGDLEAVRRHARGAVIAVIDGIGHGQDAAAAARRAHDIIAEDPQDSPIGLVMRCHEALRGTRGVVMSIVSVDLAHGSLRWLGVGNVHAVVRRGSAGPGPGSAELLLRAGVVGAGELPTLKTSVIPFREHDTLILATDGIRPQFADELSVAGPPQAIADGILASHGAGSDDALVLVARAG
jgi:negative regulator of sigma-B (phosphoserine phosphatase)